MTADHYNALHIAAKQHNHDVAAALIEHNAPLTATTKKGFTALHLAAKYGNLKVGQIGLYTWFVLVSFKTDFLKYFANIVKPLGT